MIFLLNCVALPMRKEFESEKLQFPKFEQVRGGMLATIPRERFVTINNGTLQKSDQETETTQKTTQKTDSGTETTQKTTEKTTEKTEVVAGKLPESCQKNIVENIVEKLPAKQAQIVRLMIAKSTISAKEIANDLSIAPRNVQVHIKKLQEQGIIRRIGPDKGGHWEVVEKP